MSSGHSRPSAELLAHISAPSGARDDVTYAAQVAACLSFEVETRTNVLQLDDGGLQGAVSEKTTVASDAAAYGGNNGGDGDYGGNPSQSPSSSSQASASDTGDADDSIRHGDWITLLESDESPGGSPQEHDKRQELKKQEEQKQQGHYEKPVATPTGLYDVTFTNIGDAEPPDDQAANNALQLRAQDEVTNSRSDCRPDSFETPPAEVPDSHSTIVSSQISAQTDSWMEAEVNNSPPLHARNPPLQRTLSISPRPQSGSQSQTPKATQVAQTTSSPAPSASFRIFTSSLPLTITSAEPPKAPSSTSATRRFKTHITRPLTMIVERIQISRVFRPARQTRHLARAERGYWVVPLVVVDYTPPPPSQSFPAKGVEPHETVHTKAEPNVWCTTCFRKFWEFLQSFIEENRAGWGVWCICESESVGSSNGHGHDYGDAVQTRCTHQRATLAVTVKIYAWGEIASHIWVLSYLASDRKIRRVRGVEWRDANGETVICM